MKLHAALRLSSLATLAACALAAQTPALVIQDAWVRQTPGSHVAAVYFTIHNTSARPAVIVGVESSVATQAMIHETRTAGGQSRMRPQEQLLVPAGKDVKLEPGGLHVMLSGLMRPLAVGQRVPLALLLKDGGKVNLAAPVRPLNAQ